MPGQELRRRDAGFDHADSDAGKGYPPTHPRRESGQAGLEVGELGRPGGENQAAAEFFARSVLLCSFHDASKYCVSGGAGILPIDWSHAPMPTKIIVIPAYNEERTIAEVVGAAVKLSLIHI